MGINTEHSSGEQQKVVVVVVVVCVPGVPMIGVYHCVMGCGGTRDTKKKNDAEQQETTPLHLSNNHQHFRPYI